MHIAPNFTFQYIKPLISLPHSMSKPIMLPDSAFNAFIAFYINHL